jgi:hypothetical protein
MTKSPVRIFSVLFLFLAVSALPSFAHKVKDADWKTGTLTKIETTRIGPPFPWGQHLQMRYTIEGADGIVYYAIRTMNPTDRPLNVTLHGPARYAIDDDHFYLADDSGKQHKLFIERKVLKSGNP